MITEAFMSFLHVLAGSLFSSIAALIPDPPTWVTDLNGAWTAALGMVPDGVAYFVPIGAAITVGLFFVGLIATLGLVRMARRVVSLFTGGGGNA